MFNRGKSPEGRAEAADDVRAQAEAEPELASDGGGSAEQAEPEHQPEPEPEETVATDAAVDVEADLAALRTRLDQLTEATEPSETTGLERVAAEASRHADMLQSTLDAQKRAQRLLAAANQVRGEASAQAEQILREAHRAAVRLQEEAEREAQAARQETADWAAGRRREIETTLAELVRTAQREQDRIRADAERTAVAHADEVARQYAARLREAAERDADALRTEARTLLEQARDAAAEVDRSTRDLSDTIASFLVTAQRQSIRLADLADSAQSPAPTPTDAVPDTPADAVPEEPATEADGDAAPEEPRSEAEGAQEAEGAAEGARSSRPLGSMFRQMGSEEW